MPQPHPDLTSVSICCAILTVSDSRTVETDSSGGLIRQTLEAAGHRVAAYQILDDQPDLIRTQVLAWSVEAEIQAILLNGGTGIAPRDSTYDAVEALLEKKLPGFGELFRWLSYAEIGSRAIASRAVAGAVGGKLLFSLPGSTAAVRLGLERLILPELAHLVRQLQG